MPRSISLPRPTVRPAGDGTAPIIWCTRREHSLPATREYFNARPDGTAHTWCRQCGADHRRERRAAIARGEVPARRSPRRVAARVAVAPAASVRATGRVPRFGVELEVKGDRYALLREMREQGLSCYDAGYTHEVRSGWKIVRDGSLTGEGLELVSPPLPTTADGYEQVRRACAALSAAGCRADRQCGLHVHHEVRHISDAAAIGRLFRGWSNAQPAIDRFLSPSRRGGQWCRYLQPGDVERAETLPSTDQATVRQHFAYADRYRALNVAAYPRYGTVEVRQHQGTIAADKTIAWIAFGRSVVAAAEAGTTLPTTRDPRELIATLREHGLPEAHAEFLLRRSDAFDRVPVR